MDEFITLENLFSAWEGFKRGKQMQIDVPLFERYLEDNLFQLHHDLNTQAYRHEPYEPFHIWDPKHRLIHKAAVRDRVVHHLVFRELDMLYNATFIHHTYSCRIGKGIHAAVNDVERALQKVSKNHHETVWALKMDIRKFFDSVDHEVLMALLRKQVKKPYGLWLLETIVRSYTSTHGAGKGIPIGNLTSQIFSNIYLSQLDFFAKQGLRVPYYFRYADDFLFLHPSREYLQGLIAPLTDFLSATLALTVHPRKIVLRKFRQGIDFVGYVLLPRYRVLRMRTQRRMFAHIHERVHAVNRGAQDEHSLQQSFHSYRGLLTHCNGYRVGQALQNMMWLEKERHIGGMLPL